MIAKPYFGAFNARWLSFEDVARTFVPVPQFRQLGHENHSVLLGPRGCGKTTLLKMLTRRALDEWDATARAGRFHMSFPRPRYEATYISSDVRWSYELSNIPETANLPENLSSQAQRVMISANAVFNLLETTEGLINNRKEIEVDISERLIRHWRLQGTLRNLVDVKSTLSRLVSELRGHLNVGNKDRIKHLFDSLPTSFFGHTLDAPTDAISLVLECLPATICPKSWALCYDELEIAPAWLWVELLEALRSSKQNVLLKLTWSPILPTGLRTSPESEADFKAIRLWHSHIADPRGFCEDLTRDFLRDRFPHLHVSQDQFFSRSILASEGTDEPLQAYERNSTEYDVFKDLASWDQSFRQLLVTRNIDPEDPTPRTRQERDQFFRKVKPIALLRHEFMFEGRNRSRKSLTIYGGKEAVYAMSEGNPRSMRGLLNDIADLSQVNVRTSDVPISVRYSDQAKVLNTASQRFLALIKASPFKFMKANRTVSKSPDISLLEFVNTVGSYFRGEIYQKSFPLDPIGSFEVSDDADEIVLAIIEQLLELGALVSMP